MSHTRTGRHIYATGSNIDAARLSGVNVDNTVICVYVVSAFCACITGLITCASTGTGTMDAGTSYEMYAVAASVIGGVFYAGRFWNSFWYGDRCSNLGCAAEWSSVCRCSGCNQKYCDWNYCCSSSASGCNCPFWKRKKQEA